MKEKCFVCKTGNMTLSGSHLYCDSCSFTRFVVTNDYIDACVVVLADLVSNTQFNNRKDVANALFEHIEKHLPMLDQYLNTVTNGQKNLGGILFSAVEAQAINLKIGTEHINPVEVAKKLVCACGDNRFHSPNKVSEVVCTSCNAPYDYKEDTGMFEPRFLCKCGYTSWYDEDDHLILCKQCDKPYMKTVYGFQEVGS